MNKIKRRVSMFMLVVIFLLSVIVIASEMLGIIEKEIEIKLEFKVDENQNKSVCFMIRIANKDLKINLCKLFIIKLITVIIRMIKYLNKTSLRRRREANLRKLLIIYIHL